MKKATSVILMVILILGCVCISVNAEEAVIIGSVASGTANVRLSDAKFEMSSMLKKDYTGSDLSGFSSEWYEYYIDIPSNITNDFIRFTIADYSPNYAVSVNGENFKMLSDYGDKEITDFKNGDVITINLQAFGQNVTYKFTIRITELALPTILSIDFGSDMLIGLTQKDTGISGYDKDVFDYYLELAKGEDGSLLTIITNSELVSSLSINGMHPVINKIGMIRRYFNREYGYFSEYYDIEEGDAFEITSKNSIGEITYTFTVKITEMPPTGDVDFSGDFNIADVTCVQKYLANLEDLNHFQWNLADFNEDYEVDISDCTAMQKELAGIAWK